MECLIYSDMYPKSILDLLIVLFQINLSELKKKDFSKWLMNSIDIIEKFKLFWK